MTVTATFAVELKDETSGAATAAASSLSKLKTKIDEDVAALRQMQSAMRNLKGNTSTSSAAFANLRDNIAAQKAAIASAQSRYLQLGGTFGKTSSAGGAFSSRLAELGGALQQSGGLLGTLGGGLSRLAPALAASPALILGVVTALASLGAATIAAIGTLLRYGVVESDARRSDELRIEGLNMLRRSYGMVTASASDYMAAIDRASDSTNVGRSALEGYARSLSRVGLRGDALTESVEAMGLAAMVEGERGANRFRALATMTRLAGGSVADLAEAYRERLGPIARRIMLSLPNQTDRLHRSLARIFSGLRIEVFLGALDQVLSLFSQTTATGRALKTIVESLFQPLIDQTETVGPVVRRFFQGMVIGALVLVVGFLRIRNAFREAFGSELFANFDSLTFALHAGVAAFALLAVSVGLAVVAFAAFALVLAAIAAVVLFLPALFFALGAAIAFALVQAVNFFSETDWPGLAQSAVDGLVSTLLAGRDQVVAAVRSLATSAADTFRATLGIESPSRVFAEFGANISAGVAEGIDTGAPSVDGSVSGLVDAPTGGGLGGSASMSFGDLIVNAGESSNPRELAIALRDELASILEGVSIEMGAS